MIIGIAIAKGAKELQAIRGETSGALAASNTAVRRFAAMALE